MQDIKYLSEEKMHAEKLKNFTPTLPPPLRSPFKKVSNGCPGAVLQGYRGPSHLRNDESGDSATEEEYLGVQRIGFWYAMSKNVNFVPVVGSIIFGLVRAIESAADHFAWAYLHFNAATGEILDTHEAQCIQNNNRKAEKHYENVEKLMATGEFEEAYKEAKSALDICSVGYKRMSLFKEAVDKADTQRPKVDSKGLRLAEGEQV